MYPGTKNKLGRKFRKLSSDRQTDARKLQHAATRVVNTENTTRIMEDEYNAQTYTILT